MSRVIEAPVLEEGTTLADIVGNDNKAKMGMVRAAKALLRAAEAQQQAYSDAGVLCAALGRPNPIVSIGGSNISAKATDEAEKFVLRFVRAMRKGAPLTMDGLSGPLS